MGIGPIVDIHSLAMVTPAERPADLAGVTAVGLRQHKEGEGYSPNKKASRGLEEDDAEDSAAHEDERVDTGVIPDRTISFFA